MITPNGQKGFYFSHFLLFIFSRLLFRLSEEKLKPNVMEAQARIRQKAEDHCHMLRDLQRWEDEMKRHDANLSNRPAVPPDAAEVSKTKKAPPPSRTGILHLPEGRNISKDTPAVRIIRPVSSVAAEEAKTTTATATTTRMAHEERQRGNSFFEAGCFDDAIRAYSRCLRIDQNQAIVYSNRAMAYLKKKEWARAEHDASVALALDSAHVKSYQRRASARASMGKLQAALRDLHLKDTLVAANSTTNDQGDGNKRNTGKTRSSEKMKIESMLRSAIHNAPRRRIPVAVLNGKELDADCGEDNKKQQLDSGCVVGKDGAISCASSPSNNPSNETVGYATCKPAVQYHQRHNKPKTWYEFEAKWRSLDSLTSKSKYLESSVTPKHLAILYKNGIDDVMILVDIIRAAAAIDGARDYFKCLSLTKSIDIPVMMMTMDQRNSVRDAFTKTFIAVEEVGHGVRSDDDEGTSMHSEQMISKKLLGCAYLESRDLLT